MTSVTHTKWQLFRDRIKRFRQRISRSRPVQAALPFLASLYIRFVHLTSRRTVISNPDARPYLEGDKQAIYASWHGRLLMLPPECPPKTAVIVSQHNDGELIARALSHFQLPTIRGSSSGGGGRAALSAIRHFKRGHNIAMTPDGPRGPNRKAQMGAVMLAKTLRAPLIPVAYSSRHFKRLKSWDRMLVALPFTHLVICYGTPIHVADDADETALEAYRLAVEDALDDAAIRADRKAGILEEEGD